MRGIWWMIPKLKSTIISRQENSINNIKLGITKSLIMVWLINNIKPTIKLMKIKKQLKINQKRKPRKPKEISLISTTSVSIMSKSLIDQI